MAVTLLNTNTMQNGAGTPENFNFNINSGGSNVCAFAVLAFDGATSMTISAITLGGQTMTSCGSSAHNATGDAWAQAFYLVAPPTGAAVTLSVTITNNNAVNDLYANIVVFQGVDQVTPVRAGTYQTGTSASNGSLTITSNASDLTLSCINGGSAGAGTTNQTSDGTDNNGNYGGGSDHCTTPGTSITHTWTGSGNNAMVGFSIQAAGAAPGGPTLPFITTLSAKRI